MGIMRMAVALLVITEVRVEVSRYTPDRTATGPHTSSSATNVVATRLAKPVFSIADPTGIKQANITIVCQERWL